MIASMKFLTQTLVQISNKFLVFVLSILRILYLFVSFCPFIPFTSFIWQNLKSRIFRFIIFKLLHPYFVATFFLLVHILCFSISFWSSFSSSHIPVCKYGGDHFSSHTAFTSRLSALQKKDRPASLVFVVFAFCCMSLVLSLFKNSPSSYTYTRCKQHTHTHTNLLTSL